MYSGGKVKIQLPSGCNVDMSIDSYDNHYCNFTDSQFLSFNNFINAGLYFPQIMQFIVTILVILNGSTSSSDIILCNLISGILFTLIWFLGRCYKISALSFMSCLIGGNFFRFFLHFLVIAFIAFFVVKDWKVLLICIIGGIITFFIKSILFTYLSNAKYHDEIVRYVSAFKSKQ